MNLDDLQTFQRLDPQDMLGQIDRLPDQLEQAWEIGQTAALPEWRGVQQVVVCGVGGSAIGADLLAAFAAPLAAAPIVVWRNYDLPAWVAGDSTLVIASSHSGNTEETLSGFDQARQRGARLLAVSTGGELGRRAQAAGVPFWRFEHSGQPRAAVGYSFGLLLAAAARLGIVPIESGAVAEAAAAMRAQAQQLRAPVPAVHNPAKRMAGQFVGRWPTVLGADLLAPVARRWRTQIAELAKAVAQFEELPEADHNMVAGVVNPEALFGQTMVVFLQATHNHPRNRRRVSATRDTLMVEGFNTDVVEAAGESRLAQQWTCLHFGDYTGYYLAMAYAVDPTPVEAIESFKGRMAGRPGASAEPAH
jgi:glucose/mannose-6-phosphate isomerase